VGKVERYVKRKGRNGGRGNFKKEWNKMRKRKKESSGRIGGGVCGLG
jgi:hypothetical protein